MTDQTLRVVVVGAGGGDDRRGEGIGGVCIQPGVGVEVGVPSLAGCRKRTPGAGVVIGGGAVGVRAAVDAVDA